MTAESEAPASRIGERLTLAGVGLGIALLAFARFRAVNPVVLPFLQQAADPGLYRLDHAITHSVVPASSPVFALLARLQLDITGPGFIAPAYLVVAAVSGLAVWRILRERFGVRDLGLRAGLLFALALADFKFIGENKSGWLIEHNFSLTGVAIALRLWVLAFLLEGRPVAMSALLIPMNILSFKVGWPVTGFAILTLLMLKSRSPLAWGLIALSLVSPVLSALQAPGLAPGEAGPLFAALSAAWPAEDNPFGGFWVQAPLFLGGMAFSAWWLRGQPRDLAAPVGMILLASLAIWLIGGLYLQFGGRLLPLPMAVLLSPARALELAGLLMYLILLLWVARTPVLEGAERALLVLSLLVLRVTLDGRWVMLAAIIALAAFALIVLRRLTVQAGLPIFRPLSKIALPAALAVMALACGLYFALNLSGRRTTYHHDPALGFYDAAVTPGTLAMLRTIAREPGDRRILFVGRAGDWMVMKWNVLAHKSGIDGDPYYMPTLATLREQQRQTAVAGAVVNGFKQGRLDASLAQRLGDLDASIVIPADAASAVAGWRKVHDYGDWAEYAPPAAIRP